MFTVRIIFHDSVRPIATCPTLPLAVACAVRKSEVVPEAVEVVNETYELVARYVDGRRVAFKQRIEA